MKFLSQSTLPKLTITRTRRKAIFNHRTNITTFYESSISFELTIPSFFSGIGDTLNRMADNIIQMFLPRVYAL